MDATHHIIIRAPEDPHVCNVYAARWCVSDLLWEARVPGLVQPLTWTSEDAIVIRTLVEDAPVPEMYPYVVENENPENQTLWDLIEAYASAKESNLWVKEYGSGYVAKQAEAREGAAREALKEFIERT